jgi:hypothetical protein
MTKTQQLVWFVVPLVLMVAITFLAILAIHASNQMPLLFGSVTWNSDSVQELASVTWNSDIAQELASVTWNAREIPAIT